MIIDLPTMKHYLQARLKAAFNRPPPRTGGNVWYFSYGSNMKESVFADRRQITAQDSRRCTVPGYVLTYAHMDGMPFFEPTFASCVRREHSPYPTERPDVQGMAFLITRGEFTRVLATEGGSGYNDGSLGGYRVEEVEAVDFDGQTFQCLTLTNLPEDVPRRDSWRSCPSMRYKRLVVDGAKECALKPDYIEWLETQEAYDNSNHGCCEKAIKILAVLLFLPGILSMVVGNIIWLSLLGLDRPPWLLLKMMHLYSRCVIAVIIEPAIWISGVRAYDNGQHQPLSASSSVGKKED